MQNSIPAQSIQSTVAVAIRIIELTFLIDDFTLACSRSGLIGWSIAVLEVYPLETVQSDSGQQASTARLSSPTLTAPHRRFCESTWTSNFRVPFYSSVKWNAQLRCTRQLRRENFRPSWAGHTRVEFVDLPGCYLGPWVWAPDALDLVVDV